MQPLNCKQVVPSAHSGCTAFTCTTPSHAFALILRWQKGQLSEGVGWLNYFLKPMRSEWVSKLTLIQQAEMAIVSAHNSKQTELRCEVFLWIQIILSFFYLSNFLLWFALQYSLHISAARPICYHTLHAHHNLVHRYLLILRLYIIIHARKEESNYFCWFFFFSPYWRQGLPHCHPVNYFTFLIPVTHLTQTLFFFQQKLSSQCLEHRVLRAGISSWGTSVRLGTTNQGQG